MGTSPLDLVNSESFRKKLITRNLTPYAKAPNRPTQSPNYEYIQSDTSVQDSPDQLIDEPSFANQLYPLNQYGNEGGYEQVPDPGGLMNTKSNEGQYGFQDAHIIDQALPESQKWKPLNVFSNGSQTQLDSAAFFNSVDKPLTTNNYNNQPYPTTFNASLYSPVSILLSSDPQGSNGLLSQDSFIARLGAKTLKKEFEARIATQIRRQTIGRANVFNVRSGTDVLNLITGRVPLIEPNYTITVPSNPILAATDFALRLAGSILPTSTIAGSYWDTSINSGQPTTIQQLSNAFKRTAVGNFFTRLLGANKTGTQIFYNNTGGGQKSRLFANIDFNKYKPSYDRTLFDRLAGAIVGSTTNNSDFYIGSTTSDPSRVFSPGGDLPINQFGQEQQSPVYGPQELAQLYEGPSQDVRLGANGPTYSNGGGIEGGFTWVSPKYKGNAGKKVGVGGEIIRQDENFRPSSYNSTESTNKDYREGSILDDTQRLINSQPQGGRRLQHVGNAIDQVSKVFNDGYKELTKGSRVLAYVGSIGQEVGTEYCRVFAKDTPYLEYSDLQKTDGITTEGRRFSYSVLDKTYNLNIAPNKQEGGQDSTNLIGSTNNAYAKKYMFSIENLAWRTSATAGYSVSDLPICERGPNGGRVMWFPPYGLTFNENVSASWKGNDFIGRPEPIYTYNNTSRGGSLQWKIVVDHPSVLNVIVNKVLNNETNKTRIDSILDSFFAGCRKYDLYELAKKYYTINPNDLFEIQQAITSKDLSYEQLEYTLKTLNTGDKSPNGQGSTSSSANQSSTPNQDFKAKYENKGFYFDNNIPTPVVNYQTTYDNYTSTTNKTLYQKLSPTTTAPYKSSKDATSNFFTSVIESNFSDLTKMRNEFVDFLGNNENAIITVFLQGSTSAPASEAYNKSLSERRNNSVSQWFLSDTKLKDANEASPKRFIINTTALGETTTVQTNGSNGTGESYNCSSKDTQLQGEKQIYTVNAMACRRVAIGNIRVDNPAPVIPNADVTPQKGTEPVLVGTLVPKTKKIPQIETKVVERDNITKRVLRSLLSECDYFETIKQETPMVYDNLKEKLKFFQPAFHSTTPEGLNSRLTFLQQCMRPGDTIPTIRAVPPNKPYLLNTADARNTSFGAPPVLVLRVGDFYNTKIIPEGLSISYENLDINPEGVGIQPMIANITLNFKFVGGSGLKTSIDKLQNALTFNYYANTEIFDDRADVTDESYKVLDKAFLNAIGAKPPVPTTNQTQNNSGQSNDSTIGSIITTVNGDNGAVTGTISYKTFMDNFVKESQAYFTNIFNKNKEVFSQYNNAMMQNWTVERNYINGKMLVDDSKETQLFGKTKNIEKVVNKVFTDFIGNIETKKSADIDLFIAYMSDNKDFSDRVITQLKTNYVNFISGKRSEYQSAVTKIISDTTVSIQNYIQYVSRANVLPYNSVSDVGTDGLEQKNGFVIAYDIENVPENTTTFQELKDDIKLIQDNIISFYNDCSVADTFNYGNSDYKGYLLYGEETGTDKDTVYKNVFIPFSKDEMFENHSFRRSYMILSKDILDANKYQTFKNAMIDNITKNSAIIGKGNSDVGGEFDNYWQRKAKPLFESENKITETFLNDMEKGKLKKYIDNFTPYSPVSKERILAYSKVDNTTDEFKNQEKLIKSLNTNSEGKPQGSDLGIWNEGGPNVYISKVKLN
jgi:hypothetical protein